MTFGHGMTMQLIVMLWAKIGETANKKYVDLGLQWIIKYSANNGHVDGSERQPRT